MENSSTVTRRRFLQRGAAMAAAPYMLTARSLSAGRAAANDRITVGFIGMGKRSRTLLGALLGMKQIQVVAISEVEPNRRNHGKKMVEERYSKEKERTSFQGCSTCVDFREITTRKDIDAVVIGTPDHWHAIPVVEAARAKKDIYCEKPLSLTIREARVMADEVGKNKIVFQTGSQQRSEWGGRFRFACELVRSGRIGKVLTVHVGVGGPSVPCDLPVEPTPEGVAWDRWLGPAPERGYHSDLCPRGVHNHFPAWRRYREYSGGGVTDMGAHHYDIAQWGLGMDDSGPVEVSPPAGKRQPHITFKYANGVVMFQAPAQDVKFTGTDGWIEVGRSQFKAWPEAVAKEPLGKDDVHLYRSPGHLKNWVDCIRTRKPTICPAEVGARSVTVCHLSNLAHWHKRRLKWDPEAERFVGDEEANTWLDRPRRSPWTLG